MTAEADLVALCIADGVNLRRSGPDRYYARCPFHEDTRPSFQLKLNPAGYWTFKCWSSSCGEYGGAAKYRQLTGRPQPQRTEVRAAAPPRQLTVSPELCHTAAVHYNRQLPAHPEAQNYLETRGVPLELAARWGLGYAPGDTLHRQLRDELETEELERCYLFRSHQRADRQARRIIIPNWQPDGCAGWHTARAIDPDNDRPYQALPGARPPLLALRGSPSRSGFTIIVEGPFDLMACLTAGYDARCTAGNPDPRPLTRALRALPTRRVGILPDRDPAGDQWAETMLAACREARKPALVLQLPEPFTDPGETLTATHGPRPAIATAVRVARVRQTQR